MAEEVEDVLKQLGLTDGEINVYTALLKLGTCTTGKIMKETTISNSKVYDVLDKLVAKSLASYVIENNKRHYAATPASRLIDYLEDKKSEIEGQQESLKKLIPNLEKIRQESSIPEAMIYRGKKGALGVLNEIAEAGKRGEEIVGMGTDDYATHFVAQTKEYVELAKKHKFRERLIFGPGYKSPNRSAKIRFLPQEYVIPVRTIVYGDKVAIIDFTEPMTTIVLNKKDIAQAYLTHFNMLWEVAK